MFSYALKNIMGFRNKIEDWAKELYELRCQIVHGEPIDPKKLLVSKDRHYPHFDIAKKMFKSCLWFILEGYWYIIFNREQKFKIIQNLCNKIISNKEKVKNILKRKNNYSFKAFLDNKKLYEEFIKKTRALTPSDYSAQKELKDLLVIVFEIAKDWIYYETERQTIQSYKNIKAKENFNDIIKLFHDIEKIKWSEKGKLLIDTKIFDIFSKLEEFEHVLTEDIIEFNILYFLQTTLRNYLYIF